MLYKFTLRLWIYVIQVYLKVMDICYTSLPQGYGYMLYKFTLRLWIYVIQVYLKVMDIFYTSLP